MLARLNLTLHFVADRPYTGPAFGGSMLRGAFGLALKRTVCVMRLRECTGCTLEHACLYTTIFETRPNPEVALMRNYQRAPHPFLLAVAPPREELARRETGGALQVNVRLFGDAARAAPFVLKAFEEAGRTGFGAARTPHELTRVTGADGATLWQTGATFRPLRPDTAQPAPVARWSKWRFISPVRLKKDGKLVGAAELQAADLCMSVVRRLGLLAGFFGEGTASLDFQALKLAAEKASIVGKSLQWRELRRYSSRQSMELAMGGLTGELTLDHGGDEALAQVLAWAPVLHVGKAATMGLGEVMIEDLPSAALATSKPDEVAA